jgi:transposase
LSDLCAWLTQVGGCDPAEIAVAIEVPHGAVVDTLLERGFEVLSINPKQLDRFRDRFSMSGAKDDRRDARVLADSLRTDPRSYRRLKVDEPTIIELREWSRVGEQLQTQRTRLSNQVRDQLRRYYPQALAVSDDPAADWFLELWQAVPTPQRATRTRRSTVAAILGRNRIRKINAQQILDILRQQALYVAPGTAEAATAHIGLLVEQLRLINHQIGECNRRLDALCARLSETPAQSTDGDQRCERRDAEILQSLPGVGRIVRATLLAEASQPLGARDYRALRSLCGTAPVTRQSGKSRSVVMRRGCHRRLRTAVYHWARVAIQHDERSRLAYAALRTRGHSHPRALRSVADRLLQVACAMLKQQTLYDPDRRSGSPRPA